MPISNETSLWRISTMPTKAPKLVAAIKRYMPAEAFYDWAGALIWLEVPADGRRRQPPTIRRVTSRSTAAMPR